MDSENIKKIKREYHKRWRDMNKERWREISLDAYHRAMEDPNKKKQYRYKHTEARMKRRENNEKELINERLTAQLNYWENCENTRLKKNAEYHLKKMWKNKELHDNDEQMLCCELKRVKNNDVLEYIVNNYDKYFEIKSKTNI